MPVDWSKFLTQFSDVGSTLKGIAGAALPECTACHKPSIPIPCIRCQSFFCQDHGYFCLGRKECLCRQCILELLQSEGVEHNNLDPWEVLGIEQGSTKKQVERAFRLRSRECHPDFFPGDKQKEKEFARIQWARASILETI